MLFLIFALKNDVKPGCNTKMSEVLCPVKTFYTVINPLLLLVLNGHRWFYLKSPGCSRFPGGPRAPAALASAAAPVAESRHSHPRGSVLEFMCACVCLWLIQAPMWSASTLHGCFIGQMLVLPDNAGLQKLIFEPIVGILAPTYKRKWQTSCGWNIFSKCQRFNIWSFYFLSKEAEHSLAEFHKRSSQRGFFYFGNVNVSCVYVMCPFFG